MANNNDKQKCKLCIGGYSSVKEAALCDYTPDTCPEGTEKSGFACLECLNGKFTAVPGSANCNYCGLGKAFTNYNTACTYCPSGTYQTDSDVPNVTCSSCPNGTASILNTDLDYTCQYNANTCPAGTYHNGVTECIACEGKACAIGLFPLFHSAIRRGVVLCSHIPSLSLFLISGKSENRNRCHQSNRVSVLPNGVPVRGYNTTMYRVSRWAIPTTRCHLQPPLQNM